MKLVKIYSNKPFKATRFNSGFNVILGEAREKKDKTKHSHNLGKSLLIDVIDFLMLKNITKDHFLKKHKDKFTGYVFYLEIELNRGRFLVIRRSVNQASRVSFKLNDFRLKNFDEEIPWDQENVPEQKAKELLNKYLGFDAAPHWPYRKSISYFLRTQNDFHDVFQLAKFNKGVHRDWKPFLFDMLGFDGKCMRDKYDIEKEKNDLNALITQVKARFDLRAEEADKIKGIIQIKSEEQKECETKIDDFNFYLQDKRINQELVDTIDSRISALNTIRYNITEEITRIEAGLQVDIPGINIDELKQLYEEVSVFFPGNLVKEYKDLEEFNDHVSKERKKYLAERLKDLNDELAPLELELKELEQQQSDMLSILKDKDSYGKFKHYQKMLAKIEAEIARLEEKLANLGKVKDLEIQLEELQERNKKKAEQIKELILQRNDTYNEVRSRFNRIIKAVLNVPAIIHIFQNKEGNIDFHADIQDPGNLEITAGAYGTTYKKLLCMAFDLAVLITYSGRSFFRFTYHDGALEGLDNRKKFNLINIVRDICREFGIQYILTLIDSDMPRDEMDRAVVFPDDEIILRLHERDDSGRLFEMSF